MDDVDFTTTDREELFGLGVYDGVGDRLGTVGGVDADANALIVVPNPGRIEEGWAQADEDTAVGFDANWFGVADESYQAVDSQSDAPSEEVGTDLPPEEDVPDADEWPYTVVPGNVDRIDDDGVHLRI